MMVTNLNPEDFPTPQSFMHAVEHRFDVDPVEFKAFWGVSVEHAAKHNRSWTGQHGFHACTSQPCVDPIDYLFGVAGKMCVCDCHDRSKA